MPALLKLALEYRGETKEITFEVQRIINFGYAARDQENVRRHIAELKRMGVPAPDQVPTYYPKPAHLITTESWILAPDQEGSGEIEYVLLIGRDRIYVGLGSDHTDRKLEELNLTLKSKQIYPNVLAGKVWLLEEVRDYWDDLWLRSWVAQSPDPYQEGQLRALMPPEQLIDLTEKIWGKNLSGTVIYSGTLPTVRGEIVYSSVFRGQLHDPRQDREITLAYQVRPLIPPGGGLHGDRGDH